MMKTYTFKFRNPSKGTTTLREVEVKTTKDLLALCEKARSWTNETEEGGRYVTVTNGDGRRLAVDDLLGILRGEREPLPPIPKETLKEVLDLLSIGELVKLCLQTGLHHFRSKEMEKIRNTTIRNRWWGGQQEMSDGAKKVRAMTGEQLAAIYPTDSRVGSRSAIMQSVSEHIYRNKEDKVVAAILKRLEV